MRRVVVTGMGMISPCGNSLKESWQAVLTAKSAVAPITLFDIKDIPVGIAAEVKNFDASKYFDAKESRKTSRVVQFAVAAGVDAWADAGLDKGLFDSERAGAAIGVGMGALSEIEENTIVLREKGHRRISPFFIPYAIPNMSAGVVSIRLGLEGPNVCTSTACASGSHAVGEAFNYIRGDQADIMVCGGAESTISPLGIAAFNAVKALSKANDCPELASRPFDRERDGFVMGEGAGLLVLEELQHAKDRGAKIYCEIVGYGLSGDGYHITAPPDGHQGGQRCMKMALKSAKIGWHELDYINAHGTSTPLNDRAETAAIKALLGDSAKSVAVSSTKGVTGHCIGAAGGMEAIFSALAIYENIVPPTANLHTPDPECDLDYTPLEARERQINVALSNSFGFGGTNASICLKKFVV